MRKWMLFVFLVLLVSGCSRAGGGGYTAGDIRGINHMQLTSSTTFDVNGYGGPNMGSYGEGGGYCCIMLPDKWRPGLKAHIEWEVDPKTASKFPGYEHWEAYLKWEKEV